jgi:cardiolipin synthase
MQAKPDPSRCASRHVGLVCLHGAAALALCTALGLAGCQTLPAPLAPPATGAAALPAVRVQGVRGALSAAQSRQLLDGLRNRRQDTDIFDRHLAVEEALADGPLTAGNAAVLLQDGPATYAAMLQAIAGARDHINLETYILDDDAVGQRFAQALLAKRRQGVQVNLIHDSVGTLFTPREFFQRLREGGVQVLEYNPANPLRAWQAGRDWSPNQRDHRKLLIVDGATAFLGGINISSVYSGSSRLHRQAVPPPDSATPATALPLRWRDTDLQLQGPVVADLQRLFLASWLQQSGAPPGPGDFFPPLPAVGRQVVRAIGSTPTQDSTSPIYATLLSAIGSAETTVHITMAYFAPDPPMLAALSDAATRGVDVQLILPSKTDSWLVFHAGRGHYDTLLQAGVKIHERQGVVLHAKTALVDGVWSTVGSTNMDWRSLVHNQEVNAVVLGTEFGDQLQRMFNSDRQDSEPVLLPAWRQRPWLARLQEFFASLWQYWL